MFMSTPGAFPLADGSPGDPKQALAKLVRWTFDLDGSTDDFSREQLHDVVCEFPRLDERRTEFELSVWLFFWRILSPLPRSVVLTR